MIAFVLLGLWFLLVTYALFGGIPYLSQKERGVKEPYFVRGHRYSKKPLPKDIVKIKFKFKVIEGGRK